MTKKRIVPLGFAVLITLGAVAVILSNLGILSLTDDQAYGVVNDFNTVVIERMDLRTFRDVDGILEYGDSVLVSSSGNGVLTYIASEGSSLPRGSVIYRISRSVSDLQIALAEADVAQAKVQVDNSTEALNSATAMPDEEDVADAQLQIDLARPILDNSQRDLRLIENTWADNLVAAQENYDASMEGYEDVYLKWLGIALADDEVSQNPLALMDQWGVKLDTLFDSDLRFVDINKLSLSEGAPPDNADTPWSEPTIYYWLNFYRATLTPTCAGNTFPSQGVCIEKEMQDSWDAYQMAQDNLDTQQTKAANAIASAKRTIALSEEGYLQAQDALGALYESPGILEIESLEKQLAVAQATLEQARDDLLEARSESSAGVLMFGDMPAWREFRDGMTPGADVEQLELNLISLGFGSLDSLLGDMIFDAETADAIKKLQADLGMSVTGRISFRDVIFLPGTSVVAISASSPSLGESVNSGTSLVSLTPVERIHTQVEQDGSLTCHLFSNQQSANIPVLSERCTTLNSTTESLQFVQTSIDVADQDLINVGSEVKVELPDESVVEGTVKEIGNVAIIPQGNQAPFLEVAVVFEGGGSFPHWTGASVTVSITKELAADVLAVPVTSLLALLGGGYALELVQPESNILVRVETGIYADGWVEVTGPSLEPGREVVMP